MIWNELTDDEQKELVKKYTKHNNIIQRMEMFAEFFYETTGEGFERCSNCDSLIFNQDLHEEHCEELKQAKADEKAMDDTYDEMRNQTREGRF